MHQIAHEFQPRAKLAARMQRFEVDGGEALALKQRDGEAVAERGEPWAKKLPLFLFRHRGGDGG